jgi:CBS domain-containing protein
MMDRRLGLRAVREARGRRVPPSATGGGQLEIQGPAKEVDVTLIQAIQRHPPVTTPDTTVRSAARQMANERTGLLPVIVQGRLVGTLSALDLAARAVGGNLDPDRRTVRALMRADPPTCRPEDTLEQVHAQMRDLRVTGLPVVEDGAHFVGFADLFDVEAALEAPVAAGPEPEMMRRVRGN